MNLSRLSVCLSILRPSYPSMYLSVRPSVHPFIHPSIHRRAGHFKSHSCRHVRVHCIHIHAQYMNWDIAASVDLRPLPDPKCSWFLADRVMVSTKPAVVRPTEQYWNLRRYSGWSSYDCAGQWCTTEVTFELLQTQAKLWSSVMTSTKYVYGHKHCQTLNWGALHS